MRRFDASATRGHVIEKLVMVVMIVGCMTVAGDSPGFADDSIGYAISGGRECSTGGADSEETSQTPGKAVPKLKLMGGPRAKQFPKDAPSQPPDPAVGVQGVKTFDCIEPRP